MRVLGIKESMVQGGIDAMVFQSIFLLFLTATDPPVRQTSSVFGQ